MLWCCACGWQGPAEQLKPNTSGGNCCPACGGSGGLVTEEDLEWGREEARKVLERDLRDGTLDL